MKDLTAKQAKAWVKQEAAKYRTFEERQARIEAERTFIAQGRAAGLDEALPRSFQAHEELLRVLFMAGVQ